MKRTIIFLRAGFLAALALLGCLAAQAQTATFTYQGRLTDVNNPSGSGAYDMQFALYNDPTASAPGNLLGVVTIPGVQVSKNIFTVRLNASAYGLTGFDGGDRWLEVRVFDSTTSNYVTLAPRQPVTSAPYALRSANAVNATNAVNAANAANAANADTLDGLDSTVFVQTGSTAFVRNQTAAQTANFNVTGSGTVGGTLSANAVNATTQYNIGGNRLLSVGPNNLFAGLDSGASNTTGIGNSLFGKSAGFNNTDGFENSFFGSFSGYGNTTGSQNSYFGTTAGFNGTTGYGNALFGTRTGYANTTGFYNSFFGTTAGYSNTEGNQNSFFGAGTGYSNTTGSDNSFFGFNTGLSTTTGIQNSFFGATSGATNTTGSYNSYFGYNAGNKNTTGAANSFFGAGAGFNNTTGPENSFFGNVAGNSNTTGSSNSFFGDRAGYSNTTGHDNSFFGRWAGFNTTGNSNAFFGSDAGFQTTTGFNNTFFGRSVGTTNTTGSNNTLIGNGANVGSGNLTFATALGSGTVVSASNTVVLGRAADSVQVPGSLAVSGTVTIGGSLTVGGTVSKGGGSFRIDYPLDPANKTLSHSFVESPDMMNIYNGNVTTDEKGEAVVTLPEYFEALNRDFRYQLTVIGQFAQAIVAEKIKDNKFRIRTDKPNVEVSWMVTGIRKDKFAEENRIPNVEEKPKDERGKCLYEPACGGDQKKP